MLYYQLFITFYELRAFGEFRSYLYPKKICKSYYRHSPTEITRYNSNSHKDRFADLSEKLKYVKNLNKSGNYKSMKGIERSEANDSKRSNVFTNSNTGKIKYHMKRKISSTKNLPGLLKDSSVSHILKSSKRTKATPAMLPNVTNFLLPILRPSQSSKCY